MQSVQHAAQPWMSTSYAAHTYLLQQLLLLQLADMHGGCHKLVVVNQAVTVNIRNGHQVLQLILQKRDAQQTNRHCCRSPARNDSSGIVCIMKLQDIEPPCLLPPSSSAAAYWRQGVPQERPQMMLEMFPSKPSEDAAANMCPAAGLTSWILCPQSCRAFLSSSTVMVPLPSASMDLNSLARPGGTQSTVWAPLHGRTAHSKLAQQLKGFCCDG